MLSLLISSASAAASSNVQARQQLRQDIFWSLVVYFAVGTDTWARAVLFPAFVGCLLSAVSGPVERMINVWGDLLQVEFCGSAELMGWERKGAPRKIIFCGKFPKKVYAGKTYTGV